MRLLIPLKRWFFQDFMTMTIRALVLSEVALLYWGLTAWGRIPVWAALGAAVAAWTMLIRVQPGMTWRLRRTHWPHPLARLSVHLYFAFCVACMVALVALVPVFVTYAVGWPVAQVASDSAGFWWSDIFRTLSTSAVGGAFALVFYGSTLGQAIVRRPRARVPIPHLPPALRGLRLVHLSDLHLGSHLHGAKLERYVRAVNALDADVIAITGDILDHDPDWIDRTLPALGQLRARHGVYAVLGNHDCYTGTEAVASGLARHTDFRVLRNEWIPVDVGAGRFYLIGLDDPSTHFGQWSVTEFPLHAVIADLPDDAPAVLMCHRPDVWPLAVEAGIPFTLVGHTHGGQIAVPGSRRLCLASLITKFPHGWFEDNGCRLYVSRGLGVAGSPIRIGAPREIAIHELEPAPHHAPAPERTLHPAEAPADA